MNSMQFDEAAQIYWGNDTLEGGAGGDTYNFNGSFGNDTVLDTDGLGTLKFDGVAMPLATIKRHATKDARCDHPRASANASASLSIAAGAYSTGARGRFGSKHRSHTQRQPFGFIHQRKGAAA